ncbi:MAG: hypothetical protein JW806_06375 [Sedimentisphaerales bacterium]|nr:hypothetical protein [Sedimentisphaerales bacterium]
MCTKRISPLKTTCYLPASILAILCISFLAQPCSAKIDKTRYITIDEISPQMDAVCLTIYKGVEIEKFNMKVVDVVRDISPGRDAILVMGTDERFIHTGPVAGCSGSPVYIDNRLAGALAFGWPYSKDPLYGITPIAEMLQAGQYDPEQKTSISPKLDFSSPIDLAKAYQQTINHVKLAAPENGPMTMLPCPLATSLPQNSFKEFEDIFESLGFLPVSVPAGTSDRLSEYADTPIEPGSLITLPLVYGDIDLSAAGTITEVIGDKVYGFGHSFVGYGPVEFPMGKGYVHTIVARITRSFKFSQTIDIVGTVYADQSTAIVGQIGKKAKMIPMRLKTERFNDVKERLYDCQIVSDRYFTPLLAGMCLEAVSTMLGNLPMDHSIQYKIHLGIKGYDDITFENFSSAIYLKECLMDATGALALIMNNPYDKCEITSLDFEVKIMPKTEVSHIWSFDLSDTTVKPGQTINAIVTLESYLTGHKDYKTQLTIPDNTPPGTYKLLLTGIRNYRNFIMKTAPYKYTPENLPSLINIINDIANTKRNQMYMILELPDEGITIETAQLPDLPLSKAMLLKDKKRSITTKPAAQWLEKTIPTDSIIIDSRYINITVEE